MQAWADSYSDPALEELPQTNLLVRWFVGLPLAQPGPDHSTLAAFHAWLTAHAPQALFADVLGFLDPEDPQATPQIVDTFALLSPVAPRPTVAHPLAHLTLRIARLWLDHAPPSLQHSLPPLDLSALAEHALLAQHLGDGLAPHLTALEPPLRLAVGDYLSALAKVQADELSCDASGFVSERPAGQRGSQRLASARAPAGRSLPEPAQNTTNSGRNCIKQWER